MFNQWWELGYLLFSFHILYLLILKKGKDEEEEEEK